MKDERWLKNVMLFNQPTAALWHSTVGTNCGYVYVLLRVCVYLCFSSHVWACTPCASLSLLRLITLESVMWNGAGGDSFRRQNKQEKVQLKIHCSALGQRADADAMSVLLKNADVY